MNGAQGIIQARASINPDGKTKIESPEILSGRLIPTKNIIERGAEGKTLVSGKIYCERGLHRKANTVIQKGRTGDEGNGGVWEWNQCDSGHRSQHIANLDYFMTILIHSVNIVRNKMKRRNLDYRLKN